jgi:hypothetical protein
MLKGGNRRPDILVIEANVSPVVIEAEVPIGGGPWRIAENRGLAAGRRSLGRTALRGNWLISVHVEFPKTLMEVPKTLIISAKFFFKKLTLKTESQIKCPNTLEKLN